MKPTLIIAAIAAVSSAAVLPNTLKERQCLVNGCKQPSLKVLSAANKNSEVRRYTIEQSWDLLLRHLYG